MENLAIALRGKEDELANILAVSCRMDKAEALPLVINELDNLEAIALTQPEILNCHPVSIVQSVKAVLRMNLTLDPNAGLVYLAARNVQSGNQWIKVLTVQRTARGEISFARQAGRILDIKSPKVIYDENGAVDKVIVEYLVPTYEGARWEERVFDKDFFHRLRIFSHKQNSKGKDDSIKKDYSNKLYSSNKGGIDPEFAKAKAIRHALKNLGANINEVVLKYDKVAQNVEPEVITTEEAYKEAEDYFTNENENLENLNLI